MNLSIQIVSLLTVASVYSSASFSAQQVPLPANYSSEIDLTKSDHPKNNSKLDSDLKTILSRPGPDLRTSTNYEDFKDISVDHATRAWSLMRLETLKVVNRQLDQFLPQLNELLMEEPRISNDCLEAINVTLMGARSLESWAIQSE